MHESRFSIQRTAVNYFYKPLHQHVMATLGLRGGDLYAYAETGGSNLELPDDAVAMNGTHVSFSENIYPRYDIILCISKFSATAPLTAHSKIYDFRGATLHGINDIILASGLSVDYEEVSRDAEKLRRGMTKADKVEIDFCVNEQSATLTLVLDKQEAQKSHGLCRTAPDIANLPGGEVYYVPTDAFGTFPLRFDDGTIGMMGVQQCGIKSAELIQGNQERLDRYLALIEEDPAVGLIGELGFGTQDLPVSGQDIQDEKIIGTFHVATGRSDHLGGDITLDKFHEHSNASHEDILFSPTNTPEIKAPQVRLYRDGNYQLVIENYEPASWMKRLLAK